MMCAVMCGSVASAVLAIVSRRVTSVANGSLCLWPTVTPYAPRAAPFVALAAKNPDLRARRKDTFISDLWYHLAQCFRPSGSFPLFQHAVTAFSITLRLHGSTN